MKKLTILSLALFLAVVGAICVNATKTSAVTLANPWTDCEQDYACAEKASGITFPLKLSNYWVRAMKDMIEVSYPLDEFRNVTVRKSGKYIGDDISGVYTQYPKNETIKLKNGVEVNIRAKGNKIYVMNMTACTGYYSAYCEQGMSLEEVEGVYEVMRAAEESTPQVEANTNKYLLCQIGDLVGRDVKRIEYHNYTLDYHSKDFKKEQVIEFANACIDEGISTQGEMDCCLRMKMYPDK